LTVVKEKDIEPRILVPFVLELEYESKIIKKLLVMKEICSWLSLGLDGRNVCSQEHISFKLNLFATKHMNNFYSRARNMSTGHKGSFKTALTSALRIRIKNNITM